MTIIFADQAPMRSPTLWNAIASRARAWRYVPLVMAALVMLGIGALTTLSGTGGSEPVAYRVWSAARGTASTPAIVVANSADEWQQMWHKTGQAAPPFDARRATGVGIFLGERSGWRQVHVVGAAQRGQRLVVTFEEQPERLAPSATPVTTAPWAIITVHRMGLPISIEQRVRD
jgi:hypothetical protein